MMHQNSPKHRRERVPASAILALVIGALTISGLTQSSTLHAADWQPVAENEAQLMFDHNHMQMQVLRRVRNVHNFDRAQELLIMVGSDRNAILFANLLKPGSRTFWVEEQVSPLADRVRLFEKSADGLSGEFTRRNHINEATLMHFSAASGRKCIMFRQYSGEEDEVNAADPLGHTMTEGTFCADVNDRQMPDALITRFLSALGLRYAKKPPAPRN